MVRLNAPAPDVALDASVDGQARRVRLSDFRGRWVVLFFYPADFTFVCPTEIRGFQARRDGTLFEIRLRHRRARRHRAEAGAPRRQPRRRYGAT